LPAQQDVNDEHQSATVWANIGVVRLLIRVTTTWFNAVGGCIRGVFRFFAHQLFTSPRQVVLACGVGDQSVVPDAVESPLCAAAHNGL
jgi:hypothetical protein